MDGKQERRVNSFIKAVEDGSIILQDHWQLVLVIASLILVSHFTIYRLMRSIFGDRLTEEEFFSLGTAGWLLPACLLSVLWYGLRISVLPKLNAGILIGLFAILVVILFLRMDPGGGVRIAERSRGTIICLLAILCISIPLRLAFISALVLPLYFDSTRHYAIINSISGSLGLAASPTGLAWLTTDYYHIGFHFLASMLTSTLDVDVPQVMLVLGQMIVAVMPLSAFFLIKHETRSNSAGLVAVFLAGFGWSMPAYALNWGKYPAVTSMALLPFVLSAAYLAARSRNGLTKPNKWTLYTMLVFAIAMCGFLHSRSLVVIALAALAWIIAGWWEDLPQRPRLLVFCAVLLGILFGGVFIYNQEALQTLFNPYISQRAYVTVLVLFLSIFAQRAYPKLTVATLVAIFLLLCALFIPTPELIPRLANRTLLDRPFVEMILYLPLTMLGGLGLAGLVQTLQQVRAHAATSLVLQEEHIGILFIVFLIGITVLPYEFRPSECCIIAGRDDITAMNWIRAHVPADATILISADELMVSSSDLPQGYAPADAGAWITSLTGRATVPMLYFTNLSKDNKFESLCKMDIDYIYIGGIGLSFHAPRLREHPDWYRPVLSRSRVELYQVIGC